MNIELTTVHFTPRQAQQFIMMELLNSLGVFDLKDGIAIIEFDRDGEIKNVKISKNYRRPHKEDLTTSISNPS